MVTGDSGADLPAIGTEIGADRKIVDPGQLSRMSDDELKKEVYEIAYSQEQALKTSLGCHNTQNKQEIVLSQHGVKTPRHKKAAIGIAVNRGQTLQKMQARMVIA